MLAWAILFGILFAAPVVAFFALMIWAGLKGY